MNRLSRLLTPLVFIFLLALTSTTLAQETDCSDGIDNDGDGFVDCYDNNCAGDNACTEFFFGNDVSCSDEPDVTNFSIALEWGSNDKTANSHASPMVGDMDNDGIPEIVVTNRNASNDGSENTNFLTILNGEDGTTQNQVTLPFTPHNVIAIARMEKDDDCALIAVTQTEGNKVAVYDCNLNQLWSDNLPQRSNANPAFADFNEDGTPELYLQSQIRNPVNGNVLVNGTSQLLPGETWINTVAAAPVAANFLDPSDGCIGDCNGLELAAGKYIYSVDLASGSLTIERDMNPDIAASGISGQFFPKVFWGNRQAAGPSIADYNQDGNLDILISGALGSGNSSPTTVFFWDYTNGSVDIYQDPGNNHSKGTGRLNIADLDNDGNLNVNYVSNQKLYSLDENMNLLWVKAIKEGSSGFTGCTLFDFDDDGTVETVYRSESELLIIDGTDGSTRRSIPCVSRTQEEYPIVADVDGDGASEICVTCYTSDGLSFNPYNPNSVFAQVRIYGASDGESWQPSRPVWNQSSYFNVNINDDLTVPVELQNHTKVFSDGECTTGENRALNNFMVQSPVLNQDGCSNYVTPDLDVGSQITATAAQCPETDIDISFEVGNVGDVAISGTIPVSFYAGDPFQAGSQYLNTETITISNLDVGETQPFTETAQGIGGDYTLFMVINDAGGTPPITFEPAAIPECGDELNNIGAVDVTSDPFTLSVEKVFDNRKCSPGGDALPDNGQARAYYNGTLTTLETPYQETFTDNAVGATSDTGDSPWTRTVNSGATIASVQENSGNKRFNLRNGDVLWSSGPIDISSLTNVSVMADMFAEGPMETSGGAKDYMNLWYDLDGTTDSLINGTGVGNFGYQSALATNLSGSTIEVFALLHNTANGEDYFLDNVRVQGFSSSTQEFTEADGFTFEWFADAATDPGLTNVLHSGSTYPSMAEGTYQVRGYFNDGNCFSDIQEITIDLDDEPDFQAAAYEISPLTDCSTPNGQVTAFAYTFEESPGVPGDTLKNGYSFEWTFTSGGVTTLGTADTLSFLEANQYRVTITEDLTGCTRTADVDVNTELVDPDDIEVVATPTNITTCGGTGEASAFVDEDPGSGVSANTSDYTFEWFDGQSEKATPDFTGVNYTGLAEGFYTVRARENASSCVSTAVTIEIENVSSDPEPTSTSTDNTTCSLDATGSITVDPDGPGGSADPANFSYEWYIGTNTIPENRLPAALASAQFGAGEWEMTGLRGNTYTIIVTEDATGCSTTITQDVIDDFVEPEFTISNPVDTENSMIIDNDGRVEIPQAINGLTSLTVSYWANLTSDNYANDERIFSSGATGESQVLLWSDNHDGLSFVVKTNAGDRARVNSSYSATGWVNVVGTWDGATGETKLYANGVLIGEDNFTGSGDIVNAGPSMFIGSDNNPGTKKFEGELDEFRIYDKALSISEINDQMCTELTGTEDGLIVYYDFNSANISGNTIQDQAPANDANGLGQTNGTISTPNDPSEITFQTADIECPIVGAQNNTSCDADNPNGGLDVSGFVDPAGDYTYRLYEGFSTATLLQTNTTGDFTNLAGGFYTVTAEDNTTECITSPATFSISDVPDNPSIFTSITDDTSCDGGTADGSIEVTSSSSTSTSLFTYELFDGAGFGTPIGTPVTDVDGATGHTFSDLEDGTYRIRVTNQDLTCTNFVDVQVGDGSVNPVFTPGSPTVTNNTSCDPTDANGNITVQIDGDNENNYLFTWYDGETTSDPELVIAQPGENNLSGLEAGKYTVVAEHQTTGCTTTELTAEVFDQPTFPDLVMDNVNPQTDCGPGNGSAETYVDDTDGTYGCGSGQCTEADGDFTFQWYVGSGTGGAQVPDGDGGNTSSVMNLAAGTYTVEVTDPLGCTNTEEVTIGLAQEFPSISLNATTDNTGCNAGSYDGSVTFNVEYEGSPVTDFSNFHFTIYEGSGTGGSTEASGNNNTFGSLDGGIYTVEVEGPNQCVSSTLEFAIDETLALPSFNVDGSGTNDNTVCDPTIGTSDYNGQITVSTTDGSTEDQYSYDWFEGATTDPINDLTTNVPSASIDGDGNIASGLPGGTYTVRITDTGNLNNACDITITHSIQDDFTDVPLVDDLTGSSTKTDLTVCEDNAAWPNGAINASVSGGSGNYTFNWYYGSSVDAARLISDNDNIASIKGTGNSNALVAGATTNNIQNIDPGFYTLEVIDAERGCVSTAETFEILDDQPVVDFSASVLQDDISCTSENGEVTVTQNSGSSTYSFEWYEGGSATGPTIATTQTATGLDAGNYTVKVIDDATSCFYVETVTVEEFEPTIDITASVDSDQTNCSPNGAVSVTVDNVTWTPAGPPSGYTGGNYSYQWYLGPGTSTPISDGDDLGNDSNPVGSQTDNLTGLAAGTYTIVVTDDESGCTSATETVVVDDAISANAPDLEFNATLIPGDCESVGSFEVRMLTNPSGHNFSFEFYEGAQDYASINNYQDADSLSTGEKLASNPSGPDITVTAVTESTAGGAFNNSIEDVLSGVYTVVVTDQTTGCRYQEFYNLPFLNQQTTTTITVENVDACPDNGVARVGLQEDGGNGFIDGEVDDISEYVLYLYAGDGIPADRVSPYTGENGIRFPLKYDAAGGEILDGDDNLYSNNGEPTPSLNTNDQAEFHGLPPGDYIAVAREIPNPAFNPASTSECWSAASFDKEIIDLAYDPLVDDFTSSPNTNCDVAGLGGNGELIVTAAEDPEENMNDPEFQQPDGYRFTWVSVSSGSTIQTDDIFTESATSTVSNLEPGDYELTLSRAFETLDVAFTYTNAQTFEDGEVIDFSGGSVGVITDGGVSTGPDALNVYITTGPNPTTAETITGRGSGATAGIDAVSAGAVYENGCTLTETYTVEDEPAFHEVTGPLSVTDAENCSPDDTGVITVTNGNVTSGDTNDYHFAFYPTLTDAENNTNALQGFSASATYNAPAPAAGTYYVVAEHQATGCTSTPFETEIENLTVEPSVSFSNLVPDTSCDPAANEGLGSIDFTIDNATDGDYDFQWYVGTDTSTPLTASGAITGEAGTINDPGPYQATLSNIDGGTYTLEVIDRTPTSDNCSVLATVTLTENSIDPTIENTATYVDLSDNTNCTNPNGHIEIIAVKEGSTDVAVTPANYSFQWFDPTGTDITGSAIAGTTVAGTDNRIENLEAISDGVYEVIITNITTECSSPARIEIPVEDLGVNPSVQVASGGITADFYCDNTNNRGTGALSLDVFQDGTQLDNPTIDNSLYVVEWYRGTTVQTPAHPDFLFDNQGNTNGDATVIGDADGSDIAAITGLSAGQYTVYISQTGGSASAPNFGCDVEATFDVPKAEDIPSLDESTIAANAVDNTICDPGFDGSYTVNGSITINDADVSTGDLGDFDITIEKDAVGSGDVRLSATNPPATSVSATSLEPGEYYISAVNTTTGCSAAAVRVNIEDLSFTPNIQLTGLEDNLNCGGGPDAVGSITVTADGSDETDPDYNFQWYAGSGTGSPLGGETSATITGLNAGDYTVEVQNVATGCVSTQVFTIDNVDDDPIIINYEANNQTICTPDNGSFVLLEIDQNGTILDEAAMDAAGDYSLEVFTVAGDLSQGTATTSPYEITGLGVDSYYAVVTNTGSNCPSEPIFFDVEDGSIEPVLEVEVTQNDDPCTLANGELVATADGFDDTNTDYVFNWYEYDNDTDTRGVLVANASTISNQIGGFYEVEVTYTPSGCTVSTVAQLFENDTTDVDIDAATVVDASECTPYNGSITVDAMNQDTPQDYVFDLYDEVPGNPGATPIDNRPAGSNPVSFTGLAPGVYYLLATHDTRGCVMPTPLQFTIEDISTPPVIDFVAFDPNTRCDPGSPNGSISAEADGSTSTDPATGYTFDWTGTDEFGAPVAGLPNNATISGIPAGTYNLTVTNNATGCTTTAAPYVLTNESPSPLRISVTSSGNNGCANFNGQMAATVIQPQYPLDEYEYLWFNGNQSSPDLNNPDYTGSLITGLEHGNYTLVVRDDPAVGNDICESAVLDVTVADERPTDFVPEVEIVRDVTNCFADLPNGHAEVVNEDLGQYSIEWFEASDMSTPLKSGFFIDSLTVGNYVVRMTNLISSCSFETPFSIIDATETVPNPEVTLIANNTNCTVPNGEMVATIAGTTEGYRFDWFAADDTNLENVLFTGSNPGGLEEGDYLVRATNTSTGCESGTSAITIEKVITDPVFEVISTNSICLRTEDGAINQFNGEAYISFQSFNFIDSAAWFDEDGVRLTFPASGEPITDGAVTGLAPGDYTVSFRANNGCTYESSFSINTAVQVFNFVSANGDTKNDFFLIDCLDFFPENNVQIFTRAGQKVYEADGYNNADKRFEGYSDAGNELPAGTYYYIIDRGDGSDLLQGYLELVR